MSKTQPIEEVDGYSLLRKVDDAMSSVKRGNHREALLTLLSMKPSMKVTNDALDTLLQRSHTTSRKDSPSPDAISSYLSGIGYKGADSLKLLSQDNLMVDKPLLTRTPCTSRPKTPPVEGEAAERLSSKLADAILDHLLPAASQTSSSRVAAALRAPANRTQSNGHSKSVRDDASIAHAAVSAFHELGSLRTGAEAASTSIDTSTSASSTSSQSHASAFSRRMSSIKTLPIGNHAHDVCAAALIHLPSTTAEHALRLQDASNSTLRSDLRMVAQKVTQCRHEMEDEQSLHSKSFADIQRGYLEVRAEGVVKSSAADSSSDSATTSTRSSSSSSSLATLASSQAESLAMESLSPQERDTIMAAFDDIDSLRSIIASNMPLPQLVSARAMQANATLDKSVDRDETLQALYRSLLSLSQSLATHVALKQEEMRLVRSQVKQLTDVCEMTRLSMQSEHVIPLPELLSELAEGVSVSADTKPFPRNRANKPLVEELSKLARAAAKRRYDSEQAAQLEALRSEYAARISEMQHNCEQQLEDLQKSFTERYDDELRDLNDQYDIVKRHSSRECHALQRNIDDYTANHTLKKAVRRAIKTVEDKLRGTSTLQRHLLTAVHKSTANYFVRCLQLAPFSETALSMLRAAAIPAQFRVSAAAVRHMSQHNTDDSPFTTHVDVIREAHGHDAAGVTAEKDEEDAALTARIRRKTLAKMQVARLVDKDAPLEEILQYSPAPTPLEIAENAPNAVVAVAYALSAL